MRILEPAELGPSDDLAVARAHVASCAAPDDVVVVARDEVLAFVDRHPDALVRTCAPGHLTGSALVYDPAGDRFVLLHHAKLRKWLQPGGHADGDANLPAVALREATEETGIVGLSVVVPAIDVDVHLVRPPHEPAHLHHDVRYLVLAPAGAEVCGNHESTELRWCRAEDLAALDADASVGRLVAAGRAAVAALTRRSAPDTA